MTNLKTVPIKSRLDNYIWLIIDEHQQSAIVVDPGEAAPVLDYVRNHRLSLAAMLVTHHHRDHCQGIAELQQHFAVPVYGPQHPHIPATDRVGEGGRIALAEWGLAFQVLLLPGHTLTHVAYFDAQQQWLFCGDTLFSAGCGRLFEGSAAQMWSSLMRLAALPDSTQVYCAHEYTVANLHFAIQVEPDNRVLQEYLQKILVLRQQEVVTLPSTIGVEKQINPFLRCQQRAVRESVMRFHGLPLEDPVSVFAQLRRWKDVF